MKVTGWKAYLPVDRSQHQYLTVLFWSLPGDRAKLTHSRHSRTSALREANELGGPTDADEKAVRSTYSDFV